MCAHQRPRTLRRRRRASRGLQTLRLALPLALLATPGGAGAQTPLPLQAGGTYPEGAVVTSAAAGVTLSIPSGFRARWDADLGALGLASADGTILAAVWGWSEGTMEEAEAVVGRRLADAGLRLSPRGEPEVEEREARGRYDVATEDGPAVLRGVLRAGDDGNVVAVAALTAPDGMADADRVVDEILETVRLTPPAAAGWRARVEGVVLATGSASSDFSTGGAGGSGSAASQSRSTLRLCSGRAYAYQEESETYISIPGASASRTSRDGHQGAWYLVADLLGTPTLVLEATDGRVFHWSVEERGEDVIVAGTAYGVAGSC